MQNMLFEKYNKRPVFYATKEFYNEYLVKKFPDNPIWIRDIFHKPTLADGRSWLFWQFANRGHLQGIEGYVDLNVFNGEQEEYDVFVGSQ